MAAVRRSLALTGVSCGLLLMGSGCLSGREYLSNGFKVGPNFCPPEDPVASHWIDTDNPRIESPREEQPRWWSVLNDSVLDSLIESGCRQNLSLRQASFRILQARAQLAVARGNLFPHTQTMNGGAYREALSRNSASRSYSGTRFFNQVDDGFNLAWEMDFWLARFLKQL